MTGSYDDIIELAHHVSKKHQPMPIMDRAAQFSPFAALTGYEDAVKETARLTDSEIELDEYEKSQLDCGLRLAAESHAVVCITYFLPDDKKAGGVYTTITGVIRHIDAVESVVILKDRTQIPVNHIFSIQFLNPQTQY